MFTKSKFALILLSVFFINQFSYAEEIPVIVISPGKTPQSLSTVGSSVTVIESDQINESTHLSLAKIIDDNSTNTNMFQMGGLGGNTGIQLRGLEKRYSTVYVDGVKMLDPSSPDGSFYMENIMKNSIDRVEILKGTQSSLYGSNAIGGTIHIFTKKGREGNHSNFEVETGSNNTKNFNYSIDGADNKFSYYLGLNKTLTDGISTMNDNTEKDEYKNDGLVGNIAYKINNNFKLENSFRLADTFYEYDAVSAATTDVNDSTDNIEASYTLKLIQEEDKFKNTLTYNKLYIERDVTESAHTYVSYYGYRDAFNFLSEYNFNLDNKIVYGIDSEFDASKYPKDFSGGKMREQDESIISQYFDYQFRPFEKLYSSFGLRSDEHTTVGRKTSGRATLAYQLDGNSKIRSSLGTGVRFPALYDYSYGFSTIVDKGGKIEDLQSERGNSFDVGYDTFINNLDLGLSVTLFKTEQKNSLLNNARTAWVQANSTGVNTSQGIELSGNWKPVDKKIDLNFGYTFVDSYDAVTCDPDQMAAFFDGECHDTDGAVDNYKVRVPRHAIQSKINYNISPILKSSLKGKYQGKTRDFGNSNNNFRDVILKDYFVFDIATSYQLFDGYKAIFNIGNIFDETSQQAYQYSSLGRSFNFIIRKGF